MTQEHKSASPSAVQVKNRHKTSGIEEKLQVIKQLEKGEGIGEIYRNVTLSYSTVHTIRDNANRIKESAKQELKCLFV
jgi:hypothetical protein